MMRLIDAEKLWLTTEYTEDGKEHKYYEQFEVDDAPTIDAEPVRHGKWIEINTESGIFLDYDEVKCSECGFVEYFNKGWARFKYCPTCGAKMDEVEE